MAHRFQADDLLRFGFCFITRMFEMGIPMSDYPSARRNEVKRLLRIAGRDYQTFTILRNHAEAEWRRPVRTSAIWHNERMGVIFTPFNIIDATADPEAPAHYAFPNGHLGDVEDNRNPAQTVAQEALKAIRRYRDR